MIGRFTCVAVVALTTLLIPSGANAGVVTGAVKLVPLGARALAVANGTTMLRGSLASQASMSMTGALSVGHARNLSWDLPRVTAMRTNGYTEAVKTQSFRFNVVPDTYQDAVFEGQPVRRFHWDRPPVNTVITVTDRLVLQVRSELTQMKRHTPYPLPFMPTEASPFLIVTKSLRLPVSSHTLIQRFARGQHTEEGVVRSVANWVASHTQYDSSMVAGPYNAAWVLKHHRATCQGYVNLTAGILRQLGIPSQVVYGWTSAEPIRLPAGSNMNYIEWATPGTAGTPHDWLNVYFPGLGWVPFDPQMEKFFVDPRHFAFLTSMDATNPTMGLWSAVPTNGMPATGHALINGGTEIVPGDGVSSTVTVHTSDSFRFHVSSVVRDVHHTVLLSR